MSATRSRIAGFLIFATVAAVCLAGCSRSADQDEPKVAAQETKAAKAKKPSPPVKKTTDGPVSPTKHPSAKGKPHEENLPKDDGLARKKLKDDYDRLVKAGDDALADKNYKDAVAAYQQAKDLMVGDEAAKKLETAQTALAAQAAQEKQAMDVARLKERAEKAYDEGRYGLAVELYTQYLDGAKDDAVAAKALAAAQAKLAADDAQKKELQKFRTLVKLADKAFQDKNIPKAAEQIAAARQIYPDNPKVDSLDRQLDQNLQDLPPDTFSRLVDMAALAAAAKRWAEADRLYALALKINNDDKIRLARLELLELRREAERQFAVLFDQGKLALKAGRPLDAIALFQQANTLFPENTLTLPWLALANDELARQERFAEFMTAARQLTKPGTYPKALLAYDQALAIFPKNPDALAERAKVQAIVDKLPANLKVNFQPGLELTVLIIRSSPQQGWVEFVKFNGQKIIDKTVFKADLTPTCNINLGQFNKQSKRWDVGPAVAGGLMNDAFADPNGTRAQVTFAPNEQVAQILVLVAPKPDPTPPPKTDKLPQITRVLTGTITKVDAQQRWIEYSYKEGPKSDKTKTAKADLVPGFGVFRGVTNKDTKQLEAGAAVSGGLTNEVFSSDTTRVQIGFADNGQVVRILVLNPKGK
jgi:tetratricopeptide (TPR) repeat protein